MRRGHRIRLARQDVLSRWQMSRHYNWRHTPGEQPGRQDCR